MSGHSKWSQIKRQKGVTDQKRGQLFTKVGKMITIAAKEDGKDPGTNFKLKLAIDKAKQVNMPKENIERAIKRGTGELAGEKIEEMTYEAYGPSGIALIIQIVTDNKQRALSEIKNVLSNNAGRLGETGSVMWMFDKKATLNTQFSVHSDKSKDELELMAIDAGASDTKRVNDFLEIYAEPKKLGKVKQNLEKQGIKIESAGIELIPKDPLKIEGSKIKEQIEKLMKELDENDDVSEIYSNMEVEN